MSVSLPPTVMTRHIPPSVALWPASHHAPLPIHCKRHTGAELERVSLPDYNVSCAAQSQDGLDLARHQTHGRGVG
jgi:hypothetical protein